MKIPQVVLTGSIAIDRIMNYQGSFRKLMRPENVHMLAVSMFIKEIHDSHGGVAANIAYNLSLLGENPILIGSVGEDAREYMKRFATRGIDVTRINYSKQPTASFNVFTDQEDNQIGGFHPGAMSDDPVSTISKFKPKNTFVAVSANDPLLMRRFVHECRDYGFRMFYDIGQQVLNSESADMAQGVQFAELLILNDYELSVLCEKIKITEDQLKNTVPVVVTTLGDRGLMIEGKEVAEPIVIKAAAVNSLVDPTGAGDAFRAGFLYGYIRNMELNVCGMLGATLAAYAVEHKGTQFHKFEFDDFIERCKFNYGDHFKDLKPKKSRGLFKKKK